jgi:hypothetical protein
MSEAIDKAVRALMELLREPEKRLIERPFQVQNRAAE